MYLAALQLGKRLLLRQNTGNALEVSRAVSSALSRSSVNWSKVEQQPQTPWSRAVSSSAFTRDKDGKDLDKPADEKDGVQEEKVEWNSWISQHFSGSSTSKLVASQPTNEQIQEEIQRMESLSLSEEGDARSEEKDELDLLLERTEEETVTALHQDRPVKNRFSNKKDAVEVPVRDTSEEDDFTASLLEDMEEVNQLAGYVYGNENKNNPNEEFALRKDRLFYPGQTYKPQDLDISIPIEKATVSTYKPRERRTYTKKIALALADCRNPRFLLQFLTDTAKILPRRKTRLAAKAQRKISREIRTARILGLVPFTTIGQSPFRFRGAIFEDRKKAMETFGDREPSS